MARIFYSLCGEGRGHAARVRTMVEQLKTEHEITIFAPDQAYEFLAPRYPAGTKNVEVQRIPGLRFHYAQGRLDFLGTLAAGAHYWWRMPGLVRRLKRAIRERRPDLVISDFEPALPRAAKKMNVPFISLDHQHFLVASNLDFLPNHLQSWASMMSLAVRAHHRGQRRTIISSFFQSELLPDLQSVVQVGPLLRPEVLQATTSDRGHILSYLRPQTPPKVIELLKATGRETLVYGLGRRSDDGPLRFRPLDEKGFVEDLASCSALIGAAGNQSLGEAIYLGKPVLALPERNHHEQMINSHFLAHMGAGEFEPLEHVKRHHVLRFMSRLTEFRERVLAFAGRIDGTPAAVQEVKACLAT